MHRRTRALTCLITTLMGSGVLIGCGGGEASIGKPADRAKAARVIEVRQLDSSKFEPELIVVKPSEIVTLRVTNRGQRIHEFFLGSKDDQKEHREEMSAATGPVDMPDRSNALTIAPGATEELTWQFPKSAAVQFGCHQPGEFDKGMRGEVKVSE